MRRPVAALWLLLVLSAASGVGAGAPVTPPRADGSVRFAVIGDSGSGAKVQYELAERLIAARQTFLYTFVLMMGDNIYGDDSPKGFAKKFELPYKPLLDAGVPFYATLGNHDAQDQRFYKGFNMGGHRYYTFTEGSVQFFVMDTTYMDRGQLEWLEQSLRESQARWKIAYGHHPFYSTGKKHGSEMDLRQLVEPLFVKYGVNAVFAGHEHFYERMAPQHGIAYFISGAAGKLRRGNIKKDPIYVAGFDEDLSFMLIEVAGDALHFEVISRAGATVDQGRFDRPPDH
jgi:hypothetical protein